MTSVGEGGGRHRLSGVGERGGGGGEEEVVRAVKFKVIGVCVCCCDVFSRNATFRIWLQRSERLSGINGSQLIILVIKNLL